MDSISRRELEEFQLELDQALATQKYADIESACWDVCFKTFKDHRLDSEDQKCILSCMRHYNLVHDRIYDVILQPEEPQKQKKK